MNLALDSASGGMLFGALIASLVILFHAPQIAEKLGIMDHPDLFRKRHPQVTPLVGGLAIMVPLLLWGAGTLFWSHYANERLVVVIVLCGAGATLVGYADDQSSTSPSSRLASLLLLTAIALALDPNLLPARLNWGSFKPLSLAPWAGYILMALSMAGFVNAVNMADGQNGIVTGMFVIWSACLMIVTGGSTQGAAQVLFETALVAFVFNMAGRVFLGDSGTYGVTFVFGILAMRAHNKWGVSAETIMVWFFIPVMDCVRLMVTRMLRGQVPSDGDRNHFHHRLQDHLGKSYALLIYLVAVGLTSLAASLRPDMSLVCLMVLVAFYFSFAWLGQASTIDEATVETSPKDRRVHQTGNDNVVLLDNKERKRDHS